MGLRHNARIMAARRVVLNKDTTREVILGDTVGQADTPEMGYHWARLPAGADENGNALYGSPFRVRANPSASYMPRADYRVFIKRLEGAWTVTGASWNDLIQKNVDPRALNPNDPYRAFRYLDEIVNLNSYGIGSGLLVSVREWLYHTSDNLVKIWRGTDASTHFDLTPFLPTAADTQCYVLLYFNITEHLADHYPLAAVASTPITTLGPTGVLGETDLQDCYDQLPTDDIIAVVKAYVLEYGQETIAGPAYDVDVRQFINVPETNSGTAPADATYILKTADSDLPNAQVMGVLGTGIVKNTTTTGLQSIAVAGTDYTTPTGAENLSGKTITSSTIDSTPIGTTTPAAGRFSSLRVYIGGVYAALLHAFTSSHTVTIPGDADVTLVGVDTVQTLLNKTIDGDDNTLSDIALTAIKTVGANVKRFVTRDASGVITDATNPPLDNLQHNHSNTANGGTLTGAAFGTQTANTGLYGPTTGSAANPTFRAMVLADIPNALITLVKLAAGTAGKLIGYDSSGAAVEVDRAVDDIAATAGETLSLHQAVYKKASDKKWYKADRDAAGPLMSDTRGIVVDIGVSGGVANSIVFVRRMGPADGFTGLTNGDPLYLDTTAGGLTQTLPTPTLDGAMVMIAPYGYATSTTTAFIDTLKATIYRQFVTAAASAIVSLTHHPDINTARTVQVRAAIYTDAISDTYGSSNQDTNISLRGPAGSTVTIDSSLTTTTFVGNNGGIIRRVAQSFSVTTAQRLTTFTPNMSASVGIGITINWSLETDNSDKPSGTVIVSGTRNIPVGPPVAITIPGAPLLGAGVKHWMVFQYVPSPGSGNYHNIYFNNSGGYASGSMKAEAEVGGVFPGTWGVFGGTNDMSCTFTTSTADGLAQSFTAASTAALTRIRLWLKKTGSPTGALTCALYSDSAGAPSSVITNGTAATVLASTLSTSYGWIEFAYSVPPPALTASTIYHIVLTTADAASSTNYVEWGADSSSPSVTGAMEVETGGSTWNTITPSTDACFEVYKRDATFIRAMPPGDFDTGTSGYGWTLGNSTPANEDTITRVKNLGVPRELYIDVSLP